MTNTTTTITTTTRNARPKKQVEVIKLSTETRDGRGRTTHWAVSNDGRTIFRSTDGRWVEHKGPWLGVPAAVREAICSIVFVWNID